MTTIGILARPDLAEARPALAELTLWLRARGVRACLEEKTAALAGLEPAETCLVASGRDMAGLADALVVLGGDGTLLAASRLLEKEIPVLGVNFGSLGFLTEIPLGELYPALQGVLDGRSQHEERRLLRVALRRRGRPERHRRRAERRRHHQGRALAHHRARGEGGRRLRLLVPRGRHHRLLPHGLDRLQPRRRRARS